jgi:hypothetical protein
MGIEEGESYKSDPNKNSFCNYANSTLDSNARSPEVEEEQEDEEIDFHTFDLRLRKYKASRQEELFAIENRQRLETMDQIRGEISFGSKCCKA